MSIAQDLANALHRFNAKERNFLMRFALLGETDPGPPTQSTNWVNSNFFLELKSVLKDAKSEPIALSDAAHCVYAAMDYHLDWLHAALCVLGHPQEIQPNKVDKDLQQCGRDDGHRYLVVGTHEDLDLMVLIEDGAVAYLVLIEAKGVASFAKPQLDSKLRRLRAILGEAHHELHDKLRFILVLLTPSENKGELSGLAEIDPSGDTGATSGSETLLHAGREPRLGRSIRIMSMPNFPKNLDRVTRCDADGRNEKGSTHESRKTTLTHWKVVRR
jgi:hypothetical protein